MEIKVGAYKGDIGKITRIEKNLLTVQVVPRVNFALMNLKLKQLEELNSKHSRVQRTPEEILKGKSKIFK